MGKKQYIKSTHEQEKVINIILKEIYHFDVATVVTRNTDTNT